MAKKQLMGTVVSNKMQKTVVVKVETIKKDLKYKRSYRHHERYKADAREGEFQIGDKVVIEECPPISREKRWRVIKKV